jgi:hypothetical protein
MIACMDELSRTRIANLIGAVTSIGAVAYLVIRWPPPSQEVFERFLASPMLWKFAGLGLLLFILARLVAFELIELVVVRRKRTHPVRRDETPPGTVLTFGAEPHQGLRQIRLRQLATEAQRHRTPEGHKFELQTRVRGPGSFIAETTAGMRSILTIPRSVRRVWFSNYGLQAPRGDPRPPSPDPHNLPRFGAASWRKRNEGHIFEFPHRSDLPTYTEFDLGVRDDTTIWPCPASWRHRLIIV